MLILVVEPSQFIRRVVAETRPLSLNRSISLPKRQRDAGSFIICLAVCIPALVGFSYVVNYALGRLLGV